MEKPKQTRARPQTSISLSQETLARLDALAKRNKRSRAAQIEWMLEGVLNAEAAAERRRQKKLTETP